MLNPCYQYAFKTSSETHFAHHTKSIAVFVNFFINLQIDNSKIYYLK